MRVVVDNARVRQTPELALYRNRTSALLKKYFRMSVELGHLPSVMGKEFFRSHVTSYDTHTFEDAVIFVHDVERCLESIHCRYRAVIVKLFFQQYTTGEASRLIGCGLTTLVRRRDEALDVLTAIFLERKLLSPILALPYDELDEEPNHEDGHDESETTLPPKKGVHSVRCIQAVMLPA